MKNNKSILIIGNQGSKMRGGKGVCEELEKNLVSKGWMIYSASGKINRLLRLVDMFITTWKYRKIYRVAVIDVFSGWAFLWAVFVSALLRILKKPFVLTLHGGNLPKFSERHQQHIKRLLNWAKVVTTPSNYLLQQMGKYRSEIQLIPNGIDINAYLFRKQEQPQANLVWLRAFHQIYNPSLAPRMLAELKKQGIEAFLTMIGPDKGDSSLQEMQVSAQKLGVNENIQVIGGVTKDQVPVQLSQGDIFLNTTQFESFGISVMEAAACGLCIVTTNVGELPYLWEHEHDALLVPPDDPAVMAAAVQRILTEPGLAERLSANARAKAEQYDWSVILPKWEKLFEEVIENA